MFPLELDGITFVTKVRFTDVGTGEDLVGCGMNFGHDGLLTPDDIRSVTETRPRTNSNKSLYSGTDFFSIHEFSKSCQVTGSKILRVMNRMRKSPVFGIPTALRASTETLNTSVNILNWDSF